MFATPVAMSSAAHHIRIKVTLIFTVYVVISYIGPPAKNVR